MVELLERADGEEVERAVGRVSQRALHQIRVVVGPRGDGAAIVQEPHREFRRVMRAAGMRLQRTVLFEALHAQRGVHAHGHLELLLTDVILRGHVERHTRVGPPRRLVLADHQRAGLRRAEPVHVAHVVARLVFAQPVEVEVVVDDLTAGLAFQIPCDAGVERVEPHDVRMDIDGDAFGQRLLVAHQPERVSLADVQRSDGQDGAGDGGELDIGLLGLARRQHGDAEPLVSLAQRQVAACGRGGGAPGIVDVHGHMDVVADGDAAARHGDGRLEPGIAKREHDGAEDHHQRHRGDGEQLMPANQRESGRAYDADDDHGPAQWGYERGEESPDRALAAAPQACRAKPSPVTRRLARCLLASLVPWFRLARFPRLLRLLRPCFG